MRSPLEHEPEFIAGIGLITVRWAALEHELEGLLGSLLKIEPAGEKTLHAVVSFAARLALVRALVSASLADGTAKRAALALLDKIGDMWRARNFLLHSHYVYAKFDHEGNYLGGMSSAGRKLGEHPKLRGKVRGKFIGPDGREIPQPKVAHHGFAYMERQRDGGIKYVSVNKGTFDNHAALVLKRSGQVRLLKQAITTMAAPLKWGSFAPPLHDKRPPRATRNLLEYLALQDRRRAPPPRPRSSRR